MQNPPQIYNSFFSFAKKLLNSSQSWKTSFLDWATTQVQFKYFREIFKQQGVYSQNFLQ